MEFADFVLKHIFVCPAEAQAQMLDYAALQETIYHQLVSGELMMVYLSDTRISGQIIDIAELSATINADRSAAVVFAVPASTHILPVDYDDEIWLGDIGNSTLKNRVRCGVILMYLASKF